MAAGGAKWAVAALVALMLAVAMQVWAVWWFTRSADPSPAAVVGAPTDAGAEIAAPLALEPPVLAEQAPTLGYGLDLAPTGEPADRGNDADEIAGKDPETPGDAPAAAGEAAVAAAEGLAEARWILEGEGGDYTLQLHTDYSVASLRRYAERNPLPEPQGWYRTAWGRDGKQVHVLVVGRYGGWSDADAAVRELRGKGVKAEPWIRAVRDVRAEMQKEAP